MRRSEALYATTLLINQNRCIEVSTHFTEFVNQLADLFRPLAITSEQDEAQRSHSSEKCAVLRLECYARTSEDDCTALRESSV